MAAQFRVKPGLMEWSTNQLLEGGGALSSERLFSSKVLGIGSGKAKSKATSSLSHGHRLHRSRCLIGQIDPKRWSVRHIMTVTEKVYSRP